MDRTESLNVSRLMAVQGIAAQVAEIPQWSEHRDMNSASKLHPGPLLKLMGLRKKCCLESQEEFIFLCIVLFESEERFKPLVTRRGGRRRHCKMRSRSPGQGRGIARG